MATKTSHLGLTKPVYAEKADVQALNGNMDILDKEVAKRTNVKNLLDNSDFRNPVNLRGQTMYGGTGWNSYTIDRWWLSGSATVTPTAQGVSLKSEGFFQWFQAFPADFSAQNEGKPFTVALCLGDGTVHIANGNIPTPGVLYDGPQVPIGSTGYLFGVYQGSTSGIWARIFCGTAQPAITVKWMALYIGSYTTDTLPPYVPKGKKVEMLNCGVPLQPVNLLVNSDFLDPVNHRGTTSTKTNGDYIADRWIVNISNSAATVSIGSGGITLEPTSSNYVSIYQKLEHYAELSGKVCTMGVCVNGVWEATTFTMANESGGKLLPCGLRVYSTGNTYQVMIRNMTGNAPVTIQRVVLYEGSYTADTLPTYVVPDKQLEMIRCGVPLQPVNLLDNSDFRKQYFIAQAGLNGLHGTTRYLGDRWIGHASIAATAQADGLLLSTNAQNSYIYQKVKVQAGKQYTFAIHAASHTGTHRIAAYNSNNSVIYAQDYAADRDTLLVTFTAGEDVVSLLYYPGYTSAGGSAAIQWAALYEGAYTADTLPAYQYKGCAAELAECQRYYQTIYRVYGESTGNVSREAIPLCPRMRVAPTVAKINGWEGSSGAGYTVQTSGTGYIDIQYSGWGNVLLGLSADL